MTGMKEGAGENPFADDEDDTGTDVQNDTATTSQQVEQAESTTGNRSRQMQIPYKFRRDGVQDGRDRVPLFLQEETQRAEREALRELEERFDDDISLTDLREALVKAGVQHLDDVEAHLEDWGYGLSFEE